MQTFFLVALFFLIEFLLGRDAVKGLRTGTLRVRWRGGDKYYSRQTQRFAYWFWMGCLLGAVLITGPLVMCWMLAETLR
ncbi:DUF2542 family protein [Rhizomicrobium electricum]|uniref:DUF2542 family protein n=1 Tax=Rhizomicrobium electricum TaxID=480070 RepID=UPI001422ECF0